MEMWLRALHKLPNSLWNSYPPPSEHLHTNDASKCFSSIYSYALTLLLSLSHIYYPGYFTWTPFLQIPHGTVAPTRRIWNARMQMSVGRKCSLRIPFPISLLCEKFELNALRHGDYSHSKNLFSHKTLINNYAAQLVRFLELILSHFRFPYDFFLELYGVQDLAIDS